MDPAITNALKSGFSIDKMKTTQDKCEK